MASAPDHSRIDLERIVLEHEAIIELSLALNAARSLDTVYQIIMRTCMGQKGITITSLFISERAAPGTFRITALKGGNSKLVGRTMMLQESVIRHLAEKTVVPIQELSSKGLPAETLDLIHTLEGILLIPILFQQQLIGILVCGPQIQTSGYAEADIEFLQRIASHAGVAINHIITLDALQETNTQLEKRYFDLKAVEEINRAMSATLDLKDVCHTLLLTLVGHLTADSGAFYIRAENDPALFRRITQIGIDVADLPPIIQVNAPLFDSIGGRPFIEKQEDLPAAILTILQAIQAQIFILVGSPKETTGLCFFGEKATGLPYQTKELQFAALLASQAVAPIRNSRFYRVILDSNQELQIAYENLTKEMTDRLSAEAKVAENELRLRTILDTANEGFMEIDSQGITTAVNPELCAILGRRLEEIIGHTLFDFIAPVDMEILRHQLADRKEGKKGTYELTFIRKDQEKINCLIHASPVFDKTGESLVYAGSFGMITDITQRKKNEEDLREYARIVSSSNDMMALIDSNNKFQKVNDAFLAGFGMDFPKLRSSPLADIFDPVAFKEIHQRLSRCFAGENIHFQCWVALPIGERRYMDMALYPYLENSGRSAVSGVIIIMRDMTLMKSLEDQLQMSQKLEAIGTLAGGIAHDFNNILSGIFGYTQLAMTNLPPGNVIHGHLEKILTASHRAADLVRQILTFSRQTSQEKRPILMAPIVKEALKLLRASLPSTIELRQTIVDKQVSCLADATQVHQVLMNLCTNAAHAIGEKSGLLEVELAPVDIDAQTAQSLDTELTPGRFVRLSVKDTGAGIAPDIMDRIFEPFFTTKEPGKGTGMGLSVTHGIVKTHDGAITVASTPGQGSTFQVYFPLLEKEATAQKKPESSQIPIGNERILAVDDEEILVLMMRELLSTLGYTVTAMTDSREALEAFTVKPDQYDLVITDETMPGMTGITLAQELMRIRADIPVILTSGFSEDQAQKKIIDCGIRGYLKKPWEKRDLAVLIRKVFEEKRP